MHGNCQKAKSLATSPRFKLTIFVSINYNRRRESGAQFSFGQSLTKEKIFSHSVTLEDGQLVSFLPRIMPKLLMNIESSDNKTLPGKWKLIILLAADKRGNSSAQCI